MKENVHSLIQAIKLRKLSKLPKEFVTLEKLSKRDNYNQNCFHMAAIFGDLENIPKQFLTLENLKAKTNGGEDCFHLAAQHGFLKQIPEEFLTEENVITENKFGENSLYLAAMNAQLHNLPTKFLTPDYLLEKYGAVSCVLTVGQGWEEAEIDISKVLERIPPRKWIPHLTKLKRIIRKKDPLILKTLVARVEGLQKMGEMESLKM